jgi:hypothetical protein
MQSNTKKAIAKGLGLQKNHAKWNGNKYFNVKQSVALVSKHIQFVSLNFTLLTNFYK